MDFVTLDDFDRAAVFVETASLGPDRLWDSLRRVEPDELTVKVKAVLATLTSDLPSYPDEFSPPLLPIPCPSRPPSSEVPPPPTLSDGKGKRTEGTGPV